MSLSSRVWSARIIPKAIKVNHSVSLGPIKHLDEDLIDSLVPSAIKRKIDIAERTGKHEGEKKLQLKDLIKDIRPRDPLYLAEKKDRIRRLRPTQFSCEIEKVIYQLLQEGKISHSHLILKHCELVQVLVDKGIRSCTVVWRIFDTVESPSESVKTRSVSKSFIVEKLDAIRPTIRYELGQRLRFRSVPELVFAGID
jgi:ribosome-binding factor A